MFSSINKTFLVAAAKIIGCSNKKIFVVPNFVAITKPFFSVWQDKVQRNVHHDHLHENTLQRTHLTLTINSVLRNPSVNSYVFTANSSQKYWHTNHSLSVQRGRVTEKNGFVTATKLGTTNKIFVAATQNSATATKRFVDKTKHFVVVTIFLSLF